MPLFSKRGALPGAAGPQLPRSLARELGGEPPVSFGVGGRGRGRGGGRRSSFQSDRGRGSFSSRGRSASSPAGRFDGQRGRGGGGSLPLRGEKRPVRETQAGSSRRYESIPLDRPRRRSKTLFSTLLDKKEQDGHSPLEAEQALQRQLEKKLGLKKGRKLSNLGDGLDELVPQASERAPPGAPKISALDELRLQAAERAAKRGAVAKKEEATLRNASDDEGAMASDDDVASGSEVGSMASDDGVASGSEIGSMASDDGVASGSEIGSMASDDGVASGSEIGSMASDDGVASGSEIGSMASDSEDSAMAMLLGSDSEDSVVESLEDRPDASPPAPNLQRYVPPGRQASEGASPAAAATRRVQGLLNRLAESNVRGIVADLGAAWDAFGRAAVTQAVAEGVVSACARGPRATPAFAAAAAVALAGLAASKGAQRTLAECLSRLATSLEEALSAEDGIGAHNLVSLLARLFAARALRADLVYSLAHRLLARFGEADVVALSELVRAAGLGLRAADPAAMKRLVLAVGARAARARELGELSARGAAMLDLVVDVKNNRQRKLGAGAGTKAGLGPAALDEGTLAWLRELGVDRVAVGGGLDWERASASRKVGLWWEPGALRLVGERGEGGEGGVEDTLQNIVPLSVVQISAQRGATSLSSAASASSAQLRQLARARGLTTPAQLAVFAAVAGSEDCAEALEKLVRLRLRGEAERELVRVPLRCCLFEGGRVANPYYAHLLNRLVRAGSRQLRLTLQLALWDALDAAERARDIRELAVLAQLAGRLWALRTLTLGALRTRGDLRRQAPRRELFLKAGLREMLRRTGGEGAARELRERAADAELAGALADFCRSKVRPWMEEQGEKGSLQRLDAFVKALEL